MFGITINGRDFSDRLLREDGFNNLNRAAIEPDTFAPVGDTMSVRLSDLDGTVASFLGLPGLGEYGEIGTFAVNAYKDGGMFFNGYVAEKSGRRSFLDADDPNSERIVEFSLIDPTVWLFSKLSKRPAGPFSPNVGPIYNIGPSPRYGLPLTAHIISLASLLSNMTIMSVSLDQDLTGLSMRREDLASILGGSTSRTVGYNRGGGGPVPQVDRAYSIGDFIQDMAALFVAHPYVDNNTFHFKASEFMGSPTEEISVFTSLGLEPSDRRSITYVRDNQVITTLVFEPPQIRYDFSERGIWYYYRNTSTLTQPTEQNGVVAITPSRGSSQDLFNLVLFQSGGVYYRREVDLWSAKISRIQNMLVPSVFLRVRTTGITHKVNTNVVLGGVPGYKIVEANIEPMTDEAELTLEYRKP